MKNIVLILLSGLFISSCIHSEKDKDGFLKIDPDSIEEVKLSSFVNNVEYLKLSSEDETYIGEIEKLVISDDRIYILDARNSVGLYVYDLKGKLVYKIDSYGRGPGEFMGPYDFAIDEKEDQLVIYDARGVKLSIFDLDTGSFIEDKKLDFRFRRFDITADRYIFYTDNRPNRKVESNIIITNRKLQVTDEHLKIQPEMRGVFFSMPMNFSQYNQTVFFTAHSNNTIYQYRNNSFQEHINVDFGDRTPPESYYQKYRDNKDRWEARGDAAYNISNYLESEDFNYFLYWINNKTYHYLSSKKDSTLFHTNNEKLNDDLMLGPLLRYPMAIIGNKMVWYQFPGTLLTYLHAKKEDMTVDEWANFVKNNEKLMSFVQNITKDDNPYLIFTEIKI